MLCVQRSRGAAARGKTGTGIEPAATVPRTTPTSAAFLAGPPQGMGFNHILTFKGPTTTVSTARSRRRVALWPSPEAFFCLLLRPWVEGSAGVGERKSAGNAVS